MSTPVGPEQFPEAQTPATAARPRWRTRTVVAMGLAAALVVGSAGTGLAVATRPDESPVAAASETQTAPTTSESTRNGYGGRSLGTQGFGGRAGGYGAPTGTSQAGTTTLETTTATDAQSVGVVVIDTVLDYENAAAAGTGVVLTADGRILTNNHVVEGAMSITVTVVATGVEYAAEVVGTDAGDDIAVLDLVDASGLAVADLDGSGAVAVGDAVTGVGNANGTGILTAAAGTVLALEESITAQNSDGSDAEVLTGLIAVDADIESGESGGPLYDADGEVIGIDTAASSGTADITGYAIPIEDALAVVAAIDAAVATGDTVTIDWTDAAGATSSAAVARMAGPVG